MPYNTCHARLVCHGKKELVTARKGQVSSWGWTAWHLPGSSSLLQLCVSIYLSISLSLYIYIYMMFYSTSTSYLGYTCIFVYIVYSIYLCYVYIYIDIISCRISIYIFQHSIHGIHFLRGRRSRCSCQPGNLETTGYGHMWLIGSSLVSHIVPSYYKFSLVTGYLQILKAPMVKRRLGHLRYRARCMWCLAIVSASSNRHR